MKLLLVDFIRNWPEDFHCLSAWTRSRTEMQWRPCTSEIHAIILPCFWRIIFFFQCLLLNVFISSHWSICRREGIIFSLFDASYDFTVLIESFYFPKKLKTGLGFVFLREDILFSLFNSSYDFSTLNIESGYFPKTLNTCYFNPREGILFSLTPLENPEEPSMPPPNLAFLEILHEFTSKLMRQDKRVVVSFLDKHMPQNIMAGSEDMYMPLFTYR